MEPNSKYLNKNQDFWALVKLSSSVIGYSRRKSKKNPNPGMIEYDLEDVKNLSVAEGHSKSIAEEVTKYLNYRSDIIENSIKNSLMDRDEAEQIFKRLKDKYNPSCELPLNKQKGKKRHHSYLTCIVNILTEQKLKGLNFNQSPRNFVKIYDANGKLVKVLSRMVDGAYPSLNSPIAIWEIKEYYGTTTFGSRVADGVYETQLDGHELNIAENIVKHDILHYLIVDDRFTWWDKGRSYLCRLIDTMHEGLVDEVIFGKEILSRWPKIIDGW